MKFRYSSDTISDDKTTYTTTEPELTYNATALFKLLQKQLTLPPKPVVRITGTHIDWMYSLGNTRTDFDLTLDIMPLILPDATTKLGHINVKRVSCDDSYHPSQIIGSALLRRSC